MDNPGSCGLGDTAGTARPQDNGAVVAALLTEDGLDPAHAARRTIGLFRLATLPPVVAAEPSGDESVRVLCRDGAHYLVTPWNTYRETSCGRTIRLTSRAHVSELRYPLQAAPADAGEIYEKNPAAHASMAGSIL